jgi:hypothetical protein
LDIINLETKNATLEQEFLVRVQVPPEDESQLYELPSQEVSFTVPGDEETLAAVIEAIYESHPYEEQVILVQSAWSTRLT